MNRCSFCEWIPILPWPVWPLAGHARLGQNTVVGSMTILLSWLCWGACQEEVCLDPRFLCNLTLPRFSVELPIIVYAGGYFEIFETLRFVQMVLQLSPPVQEHLRAWLAEHLNQIQKRERP